MHFSTDRKLPSTTFGISVVRQWLGRGGNLIENTGTLGELSTAELHPAICIASGWTGLTISRGLVDPGGTQAK